MKRWVATIAMVLGLLGVMTPAYAQQARHVRVVVDDTFPDPFLTEGCGTPVETSVEGTLNVTLIYNRDGLLMKEIDPSGGGTVTYSALETGNSFSFPFQTVILDYAPAPRSARPSRRSSSACSATFPASTQLEVWRSVPAAS